jgi:hypothetical protein
MFGGRYALPLNLWAGQSTLPLTEGWPALLISTMSFIVPSNTSRQSQNTPSVI